MHSALQVRAAAQCRGFRRGQAAMVVLNASCSWISDADGGNMIARLVNSWLQHSSADRPESSMSMIAKKSLL